MKVKIFFSAWLFFFATGCDPSLPPFRFDFEYDFELDSINWQCRTLFSLTSKYSTSGTKSLQLTFFPSPYPGIAFKKFNSDWSGKKELLFDLYNPDTQPVDLFIRVDDSDEALYSNRFNKKLSLVAGNNFLKITMKELVAPDNSRALDLKNIKSVIFFSVSPGEKFILYLDNIRLE